MPDSALNLETLTLTDARSAVVDGTTSAAALASAHYERIATVDSQIHSYLALTRERALAQAERVDAAAKAGDAEKLGPLSGVPIGIKDVLTMRGEPTTAGETLRPDVIKPCLDRAVVMAEAPETDGRFFTVPKVIER